MDSNVNIEDTFITVTDDGGKKYKATVLDVFQVEGYDENNYVYQTAPTVKHTIEGFPIILIARFADEEGYDGSDVFLGISTSGNSKNVCYAAITAKAKGLKVIGLTGARESKMSKLGDCCIRVPETETFKIQELHLPVYHCLCMMLEDKFFGK